MNMWLMNASCCKYIYISRMSVGLGEEEGNAGVVFLTTSGSGAASVLVLALGLVEKG
jgi:hypothetical protein